MKVIFGPTLIILRNQRGEEVEGDIYSAENLGLHGSGSGRALANNEWFANHICQQSDPMWPVVVLF